MAHHDLRIHPLVVRHVTVQRTIDVTPRMRRVTLAGEQLGPFTAGGLDLPGFVTDAFDDHVKLIFSLTGNVPGALPVQRPFSIDWPPCAHRVTRDYTPRRWDPQRRELDLDFVLHGDGTAEQWAREARTGADVWFVGPKSSTIIPDAVDRFLLAGDETALPAIGRFLDERPHPAPARITVLIADESARQDLALGPQDEVEWIRSGDPAILERAVRAGEWPDGRIYVWMASESSSLIPLRRWVRHEKKVPPSHVNIAGYWHARTPQRQPGASQSDLSAFDPMPWLATRAALALGLLDGLSDGPLPLQQVAAQLGVDPGGLRPLAHYLTQISVVTLEDERISLGPRGDALLGDEHARERLFGSGRDAEVLPSMLGLADAIRDGRSTWRHRHGVSMAETLASDVPLFLERLHDAETFAFVARGVPALPAWKQADSIVLTGPGAPTLAEAASGSENGPRSLRISPRRAPQEAFEGAVAGLCPIEDPSRADLVVSVMEVEPRDDDEVVAVLEDLATVSDRCLVIDATERSGPAGAGPGVRHALVTYAAAGVAPRNESRLCHLARTSGWQVRTVHRLGWDHVAMELAR